jgi:hypothetical protein
MVCSCLRPSHHENGTNRRICDIVVYVKRKNHHMGNDDPFFASVMLCSVILIGPFVCVVLSLLFSCNECMNGSPASCPLWCDIGLRCVIISCNYRSVPYRTVQYILIRVCMYFGGRKLGRKLRVRPLFRKSLDSGVATAVIIVAIDIAVFGSVFFSFLSAVLCIVLYGSISLPWLSFVRFLQ